MPAFSLTKPTETTTNAFNTTAKAGDGAGGAKSFNFNFGSS